RSAMQSQAPPASASRASRSAFAGRSSKILSWGCGRRTSRGRLGRRRKKNRVLGSHFPVRGLPGFGLLIGEPRNLHVGVDLLERGDAAGHDGVDKHEMPAEAGFDGTLPRAGWHLRDGKRELRPEFLGQVLRSALAVVVLEHEAIRERWGELRGLRLTRQLLE